MKTIIQRPDFHKFIRKKKPICIQVIFFILPGVKLGHKKIYSLNIQSWLKGSIPVFGVRTKVGHYLNAREKICLKEQGLIIES